MSYIKSLSWETGIGLIHKCMEKVRHKKHWDVWLAQIPMMDKDTKISFEDYLKKVEKTKVNVSKTPKEDIINTVERIRRKAGVK